MHFPPSMLVGMNKKCLLIMTARHKNRSLATGVRPTYSTLQSRVYFEVKTLRLSQASVAAIVSNIVFRHTPKIVAITYM